MTFLTATGPVAFDAHLVGFLVPTSGPFREDLKGDVTARACRFLYPIRFVLASQRRRRLIVRGRGGHYGQSLCFLPRR